MTQHAAQLVQQFSIQTPSVRTRSGTLSGGNAQKVVLARELARGTDIILAAQPTRGLDIGAMDYVHAQLMAQRDGGAAILLISTELDEILRLSDRIAVLYEGNIMGIVDADAVTVQQLGLWMAGQSAPNLNANPDANLDADPGPDANPDRASSHPSHSLSLDSQESAS